MKKFSKGLVFVSVGLLLIAVLLLVASALSFIFDEDYAFFVDFSDHVAIALYKTEISTDEPYIEKLSTAPLVFKKEMKESLEFDSLDYLVIDANNTDIEIKSGDKNSITSFWYKGETIRPIFTYNNSELRVSSIDSTYKNETSSKITITLTKDTMPNMDIKTKYGAISINDINSKDILLDIAGNDVKINNTNSNSLLRILSYESIIGLKNLNSSRCVLYLNQGGVTVDNIKTASLYSTSINSYSILNLGLIDHTKFVLNNSTLNIIDYKGKAIHINFKGKINLENIELERLKLSSKKESEAIINNVKTKGLNMKLSNTSLFASGGLERLKTNLYNSNVKLQLRSNNDANIKTDLYKSTVIVNDNEIDKNIDLKINDSKVSYELKLVNSKVSIYEQ